MQDETPDVGVEIRGIERRGREDGEADYALRVSVPTANPQSRSRDSEPAEDGSALVGEIPVTHADLPNVDRRLNAEFVTALEEEVRAYYPLDDSWAVVLTWDAATDEWNFDCKELETYSFEPEDVRTYDEETVIWRRVDDETAVE
jgi:hypothetical protein